MVKTSLPPLNKIDLDIKTKLLGYTLVKQEYLEYCEFKSPAGHYNCRSWLEPFSSNWGDTKHVIRKMLLEGYKFVLFYDTISFNQYAAMFWKGDRRSMAAATYPEEAVCKAALRAIDGTFWGNSRKIGRGRRK